MTKILPFLSDPGIQRQWIDNEDGTYAITEKQDLTPLPRKKFSRLTLAGLSGAGLLIVILTMAYPWGGPVEEAKPKTATPIAPARETPPVTPSASPAAPLAEPPRAEPPRAATPSPTTSARPAVTPTVATAQLCTALRDWRCEAANGPVPPGSMFFYTQLKSATATTIEHRWYQGDRLRRSVQLRVEANPGTGYRTYSRSTISRENAGDWRVELRSADGSVLHEERFTVR